MDPQQHRFNLDATLDPADNKRGKTHVLRVWGELACFTRPEMKVERYSYPIITPSAARGIFDAIFFKKGYEFYWQIEKIEMLTMPCYITLPRNEVKETISIPSPTELKKWISGEASYTPIQADDTSGGEKGRSQRQTVALKQVCYRLHAYMIFRNGGMQNRKALDEQFIRRARNGKCFYQPYLGCREFPAWVELLEEPETEEPPVKIDLDLGWMLYDVFDLSQSNDPHAPASISLFHSFVKNGVLEVPP